MGFVCAGALGASAKYVAAPLSATCPPTGFSGALQQACHDHFLDTHSPHGLFSFPAELAPIALSAGKSAISSYKITDRTCALPGESPRGTQRGAGIHGTNRRREVRPSTDDSTVALRATSETANVIVTDVSAGTADETTSFEMRSTLTVGDEFMPLSAVTAYADESPPRENSNRSRISGSTESSRSGNGVIDSKAA